MDIPRMTPEEVLDAMRSGERIVFVDARSAQSWASAFEQIPGSIRIPPDDVENAFPLAGGFDAWRRTGQRLEPKSTDAPAAQAP